MDTAHALVRRVTKSVGSGAGSSAPNGASIAVHYGLGMASAAVYAEQRRSRPWLRSGRGALYGFRLYVVHDPLAARLLRIAAPQGATRGRRTPAAFSVTWCSASSPRPRSTPSTARLAPRGEPAA